MIDCNNAFQTSARDFSKPVEDVKSIIDFDSPIIKTLNLTLEDLGKDNIINSNYSPTNTPTAANDELTSMLGRLKNGVSNLVDSIRPYKVPEKIVPTAISLERDNFVKITTTLDTNTQTRDGALSDPGTVSRERDVWVKLDDASYQHLVDMSIHHSVMEEHTLTTTTLGELQEAQKSPKTMRQAFTVTTIGKLDSAIDYIKGLAPKSNTPVNPNKTAAEIVGEGPEVTTADLDKALNSIADQIVITTKGGYVTPRDGENRALAEGEYIVGTAEFKGFGYGGLTRDRSETIAGKFGLRKEGLSPKTRQLASTGLAYNMNRMTPSLSM